jgi:hypothetical protein
MHKRLIPWYLILFPIIFCGATIYTLYEVFRHGLAQGLLLLVLSWSAYVLCVPAAHGRLLFGFLIKKIQGKSFFPEPYLWSLAALINATVFVFMPDLYAQTMLTFMLYCILTTPAYWLILAFGALGAWYRVGVGTIGYADRRKFHTLVRHGITLVGLLLFLYLLHQEFIILLSATTSG